MNTEGLYNNVYWRHPVDRFVRQIEFARTIVKYGYTPDRCCYCSFSVPFIGGGHYCHLIDDYPHCTITDFLKYILENI